jgi:hypothetical protein
MSIVGVFGREPHHHHAADLSPDSTDMARQKIKIDQPVQGQLCIDFKRRGIRRPGARALNLPQHPRIELSMSEGHVKAQLEPIRRITATAPITYDDDAQWQRRYGKWPEVDFSGFGLFYILRVRCRGFDCVVSRRQPRRAPGQRGPERGVLERMRAGLNANHAGGVMDGYGGHGPVC